MPAEPPSSPENSDYRDALITHHRRTARNTALTGSAGLPLSLARRVRQARRTRDPLAWAVIALTVATCALGWSVNYQRAAQRADDDIARDAEMRELVRRSRQGSRCRCSRTPPAG